MELICPAADLSEQISTAGKEASGTGNMKFMMNGAITIGTLDGANVEIREAVGGDNFFLFGMTVEDIEALRGSYDPQAIIDGDDGFHAGHATCSRAVTSIDLSPASSIRSFSRSGTCRPVDDRGRLSEFCGRTGSRRCYVPGRELWTRMSILNTACSGRFSTDRTMRDYNDDIWHVEPINQETS